MLLAVQVAASALAAACPANIANGLRMPAPSDSRQLITVEAASVRTTYATTRLWRRSGECWVSAGGPYAARAGRNGLRENRREGDGTTPIGMFSIGRTMYGNEPNPGVKYRYRHIRCGDWWVEDPSSPAYNTFQRIGCGRRPPFRVTTPDMSKDRHAYAYLAVVEFNMNPVVPGRGSGIFLHVQRGNATNGCVSLRRAALLRVIRWLSPAAAPRIVIGTRAGLRGK
jgi:L,D-peptidoglycan transpeptidase YkuD (ErfK/YbiS/YcfS/YnhG family)